MLDPQTAMEIFNAIQRFEGWLSRYGEISYDHQSYYAGMLGRAAKSLYYRSHLGKLLVLPMVFSEACLPAARCLFWKKQRLPIADAHYAMAFAYLHRTTGESSFHERARHFLDVLLQTRCPGFDDLCWGYPFHWQTRGGLIPAGTPLITTTPYVYEAFQAVYDIDGDRRWSDAMRSIARHARNDIKDFPVGPGEMTCSYTPTDQGGVINASAYRAFLLTEAGHRFGDGGYLAVAQGNLNFVLGHQRENGSWPYSLDEKRTFVDHFHTCFVLKALQKIAVFGENARLRHAIDRGVRYYTSNLFDGQGLPKPFSEAPRTTVYRRELYDYAECINLGILLRDRYPELDRLRDAALVDLLGAWVKPDGSFRSRALLFGWDNVPMHRWAQSQTFRALCLLTLRESGARTVGAV